MRDTMPTPHPVQVLNDYSRRFPGAWAQFAAFREMRGRELPDWPDWCWMPVAGAYAVVSQGGDIPPELVPDVGVLHALASWRLSKGIYRFDPELYEAIASTPLEREIPADVLLRLPEWCVYVEAREPDRPELRGFWACLEADANDGSRELCLVWDLETRPLCLPVHLVPGGTVAECLTDTVEASLVHAPPTSAETLDQARQDAAATAPFVARLINLVLYLCADAPDLDREPVRAQPTKTKQGRRWFPADKPQVFEVGTRTARWLREARAKAEASDPGTGAHVAPHVRRAHWHGFWTGPRDKPEARRFSVRWLPQIPVGFSVEDLDRLVPVVKRVEKG